MGKRILKGVLIAVAVVIAVVLAYVAYVLISYYRLEDKLILPVEGQAEQELQTGTTLRAMSYNIGFGAYSADYSFFMDGGDESRARSKQAVLDNTAGALEAASKLDPDLLFFQEVDVDSTRSYHVDQRDLIVQTLGEGRTYIYAQNYDSPYLFYPIFCPHGKSKSGLVTLSSFPMTSALRRSLPIEEGLMKFLDLDRCYAVSRIPLSNGKELVIYNLHLSAYTSDGSIATEQLELLFADMKAEYDRGNYTLAAGDFNKDLLGDSAEVFGIEAGGYTWAQPISQEIVPQGLRIVAPLDEEHPVPSCRNTDRPYGPDSYVVTVDGFILSDNIECVDAGVVDTGFAWSDHNPVWLDFILVD